MTFLQAIFLLGIAGIAGPIAAHLLARPRYRRVPFTMMRFLQAGQTESHARRRIRNLLILALRCAIIALIALFFAGPERLLAANDPSMAVRVVIGIDDSLSMAAGNAIDAARNAARDAIADAPDPATFHVRALATGRTLDKASRAEALAFVDELWPAAASVALSPWLTQLQSIVNEKGGPLRVWMISDFTPQVRAAMENAGDGIALESFHHVIIAHDASMANAAIAGIEVSPGADRRITVSAALTNYGVLPIEGMVTARLDGDHAESAPIQLGPREQRNVPLQLPWPDGGPEHRALEIAFQADDALSEDNRRWAGISLSGPRARHVAVFAADARQGHLLKAALDTLAKHSSLESLTVQAFTHAEFRTAAIAGADVVVLASPPIFADTAAELRDYVSGGGRLIAFVSDKESPTYEALWSEGVLPGSPTRYDTSPAAFGSAVAGDALSQNGEAIRALQNYRIDALPTRGHYAIERDSDAQVLWRYDTDEPFIAYKAAGNGETVLVNTSADDSLSPLMKSPAAVAFVQYLIGGTARLQALAFDAGQPAALPASDLEREHGQRSDRIGVQTPSGASVSAIMSGGALTLPPLFELGLVHTESKPTRYAGINVPWGEGDLTPPQDASLSLSLTRLFSTVDADSGPSGEDASLTPQAREPLWTLAAWAALLLIVVEVFVSNRMAR